MTPAQIVRIPAAICFAMLVVWAPSELVAQSATCSAEDLLAILQPTDSAYRPAKELAQVLGRHGFTVRCVLRSKMASLFEGLEGAALYRTDRGDFEALFLPKADTFAKLAVTERAENGGYVYSFDGPPKPWQANRLESPRRIYFVKRGNQCLVVSSPEVAAQLEAVLANPG